MDMEFLVGRGQAEKAWKFQGVGSTMKPLETENPGGGESDWKKTSMGYRYML